jgi:hypothetical protein
MAGLLSQPRLAPYKQVCGGKLTPALELYRWNLTVSMAFFESIHYFEIALRNVMDEALVAYTTALCCAGEWYADPLVPLSGESRKRVAQAVKRSTDDGQVPEVHGRVVAELSLGFWWSLLADPYNNTLWKNCFQAAFPRARRRKLHESIEQILKLRNRIAHHEPIHTRDLVADYTLILRASEYVSPRLAWWIDSTTRVPAVLEARPPRHPARTG